MGNDNVKKSNGSTAVGYALLGLTAIGAYSVIKGVASSVQKIYLRRKQSADLKTIENCLNIISTLENDSQDGE